MKKGWLSLVAAGIVSLLAFGTPNIADANARNRQKKADEAARRELKKDRNELERDRRDLSRLYRKGGSRDDVYRKRAEIRDDLREIAQDRRQLGRYDDYRGDRYGYGNYGRYDNSARWNRGDNGWWNWSRLSDRDRPRWDYRHD
jgi:cell division protein FtsB